MTMLFLVLDKLVLLDTLAILNKPHEKREPSQKDLAARKVYLGAAKRLFFADPTAFQGAPE
jgi:hypothetical protein